MKPIVTHVYPLAEMPQALAAACDKSTRPIKGAAAYVRGSAGE